MNLAQRNTVLATLIVWVVLIFVHNPIDGYDTEYLIYQPYLESKKIEELGLTEPNCEINFSSLYPDACKYQMPVTSWISNGALLWELSTIKFLLWAMLATGIIGFIVFQIFDKNVLLGSPARNQEKKE